MGKKREQKASKRIFTYWVNMPGSQMSQYIRLCMQTWHENIPDVEVIVVNQENIFKWIDPFFDMRAFTALSLPMQSDIVAYAVLYQHGGVFMDADTIITKNIFEEIEAFERNKVYFFGYPESKAVHLAFIACLKARNKGLLACVEQEKTLLRELLEKGSMNIEWHTFGNSIINNVIKDEALSDTVRILDRVETGAILEASFLHDQNPGTNYIDFYFKENDIPFEDVLDKIKFGAICLHNSWTPPAYQEFTLEQIWGSQLMLSKLLRHALGH